MFITPAYAQTMSANSMLASFEQSPIPMMVMIGLIIYFVMWRPHQQQTKQLKAAQDSIRRGDRVITAGGIIGTVSRVINDEEVEIQIAEGVKIRVVRSTIPTVTAKTEPSTSLEKGNKKQGTKFIAPKAANEDEESPEE